ncbi:MAG TPA: RNA-binding protein [Dissulfurispiraceae bacterium]|nr:RNA-binding protein [Dissulfurispiraceae bacterium]
MNILVRNLSRGVDEKELFQLFQSFGRIKSLNIVLDASTGKSKGFGFVDMPENFEAVAAIKALDGRLVQGLRVRVKKAVKQNYSPPRDNPDKARPERFEAGKVNSAIKGKSVSRNSTGHKKN